MKINSFKDLIVWQKAIVLVNRVYKITGQLPKHELYILVSQMTRAAISIPSNTAEGYRRNSRAEYSRFLSIALGSAAELETQIIICKQQYPNIDYSEAESLLEEVQKMLYSIITNLKEH